MKVEYLAGLDEKLKPLANFLGEKDWVVGDILSIADFVFYETIYFHNKLAPEYVSKYPNLVAHQARFEAIPKLQDFFKSEKNFNNLLPAFVSFGGNME